MASETVQIDYFLSGPFGGYGSFVSPEKDIASYEIDPFVQGQATENVKIIAYLPGCEIATFDFKLSGAAVERNLDCRPLGSVLLRGQVLPFSADGKQNQEIEVSYLALWASAFSGNLDGSSNDPFVSASFIPIRMGNSRSCCRLSTNKTGWEKVRLNSFSETAKPET